MDALHQQDTPILQVLMTVAALVARNFNFVTAFCRYCSERCRRSRGGQTAQAAPSATMAPTAPSVSHSSFKAGRSPDINKSLRCQDLGNIVHLEHLNLEASLFSLAYLPSTIDTEACNETSNTVMNDTVMSFMTTSC